MLRHSGGEVGYFSPFQAKSSGKQRKTPKIAPGQPKIRFLWPNQPKLIFSDSSCVSADLIKIGKLTPKSPRNTLFPTDLDMVYFCLRAPRAATRPPKITLKIRPQKNTQGKKTSNKQNRQEHLEKDFGQVPTGRRFPTQITPTSSFFRTKSGLIYV